MTDAAKVEERVRIKAERGEFLGQLLLAARGPSAAVQEDFVQQLCAFSVSLREVLQDEGLITKLEYEPQSFWSRVRQKTICFVDGGVARIDLPSAAPMGIRVGTYTVRLGDTSEEREKFNIDLSIVDELFSANSGTYDDAFDDIEKLTDAARIILEVATTVKAAEAHAAPDLVFLHGPLVNPAAPYGPPGFPDFTTKMRDALCGSTNAFAGTHFVDVYCELLRRLVATKTPVLGVVERNLSSRATVVHEHLRLLVDASRLSERIARATMDRIGEYRLNDSAVLSVVLGAGEVLKPVSIDRQEPRSKWPKKWEFHIEKYPRAVTTFLKASDDADPLRIESVRESALNSPALSMVLHTTKLLPRYGFPVGLDIVDKYAKVPAWMSHGIKQQHAVALLKAAINSKSPAAVEFAKKVVTARGRDWFFRPKP